VKYIWHAAAKMVRKALAEREEQQDKRAVTADSAKQIFGPIALTLLQIRTVGLPYNL